MKKVFISYHHKREQQDKDNLARLIENNSYKNELEDMSVDTGDIDETLPAEAIYNIIRNDYLKNTDVTIVILGTHTKCRKHVDREIGSSLRSYGSQNTKNGLLILLTNNFYSVNGNRITQENSGQRIYDNYINGYAEVAALRDVSFNFDALYSLVLKAHARSMKENPVNNAIFRTRNTEDCPNKYW